MKELAKKYNNIVIQFEKLPQSFLGLYVEVKETPYILLNETLCPNMYHFVFYSCLYFKDEHIGKITVSDLEKENFKPFIYANKMRDTYAQLY